MNDNTEVLPRTPAEAEQQDLTGALAQAAPRRWWNRTTLVLAGVVLLAGGFLGGVQTHKRWGATGTAAPAGSSGGAGIEAPAGSSGAAGIEAPAGSSGVAGPGGMPSPGTGFGPDRPAAPGITAGTLTRVDGHILYVQTAAGETITVRASGTTAVSRTVPATVTDLTTGAKVTVQGAADSEGVITATAITAG
ncbi:hypothetical protein [Actinoplanes teichomyceticus]|uniref:DUF5666 domain-containing protein n=1 Tax=Actinoplanes teichomyceticus TaxID=1867 RepID=A0A561WKM8_ACTTI|nr:hypothetical protein [Actinoplanes teichomyceticus]TWG24390.1 hypothetical protein FHX34_102946 [Actinoplanes teichomyceticus]